MEEIWPQRRMEETWSQRYKRNKAALQRGLPDDVRGVLEELRAREHEGRITASERRQLQQARDLVPPSAEDKG
jgi:RNA polymerase-interacting CarD/CdnL/TRCF family regulator